MGRLYPCTRFCKSTCSRFNLFKTSTPAIVTRYMCDARRRVREVGRGNICMTRYPRSGRGLSSKVTPMGHCLRRKLSMKLKDSITKKSARGLFQTVTRTVRVSGVH